jgi:hypothetical protein
MNFGRGNFRNEKQTKKHYANRTPNTPTAHATALARSSPPTLSLMLRVSEIGKFPQHFLRFLMLRNAKQKFTNLRMTRAIWVRLTTHWEMNARNSFSRRTVEDAREISIGVKLDSTAFRLKSDADAGKSQHSHQT